VSAEAFLTSPFAALPDIIRAHAAELPDHPALLEGSAALPYGALSVLMGRIAFALQRDGVRGGDAVAICAKTSINYAAAFCGVLAAGAAVAPLAPSSSPASLMMRLKDCGGKVFLLDQETAEALQGSEYEHAAKRVALDDSECRRAVLEVVASGRRDACQSRDRPQRPVQHHLFVRHDGRAEGHRAAASHALRAVQAHPLSFRLVRLSQLR
jgi:acyl-CoA synthetase (AMP-forming)/AMP-acid ligase II